MAINYSLNFFVTKMDGFTVLSEKVKSDLKTIAPSTPVEVTPTLFTIISEQLKTLLWQKGA